MQEPIKLIDLGLVTEETKGTVGFVTHDGNPSTYTSFN